MSTVMVDIRSCDSWWQRNGEAAYAVATWLQRADCSGSLGGFLSPSLTAEESGIAKMEGWILVVV
jgi:hypothetical protein